MTIIGLGNTGCSIAEKFETLTNTKVLLIDSNIEGEDNCISIKEEQTAENYEKNFPNLSNYLKIVDNDVYLIVGGSGKISGASLSLLKQMKDRNINVIYVRPDLKSIKNESRLQDKLVFNVFQEYARSGIFKNCILISNTNIENIVGDLPVIGYFDKINDIIFNVLYSVLFYEKLKPIMNNLTPVKETCRIRTVGIFDNIKDEENLFYNLQFIENKHYYYIINEQKLQSDNTILKNIKDYMEEKSKDGTDCSYAIFSTKEDVNYCYIDAFTKRIQE